MVRPVCDQSSESRGQDVIRNMRHSEGPSVAFAQADQLCGAEFTAASC